MLMNLLVGIPVMLICLIFQAIFVALCLRAYITHRKKIINLERPFVNNIVLLSLIMILMLVGNFVQMAIWAQVFIWLGEFSDFTAALYHSGVNFATLGYGDIVMSEQWRLLGPLEASNGILMFGVSTSVMTAAVMDIIKQSLGRANFPL
ncbi:ion channel [Pseudomonas sp.]|uniref:ion channel n=1 Tax=Pseudomonas sp. TaxID=306 RepID=UPI00257F5538|nr:ion channel [Pseudomonas sp.]